MSAVSSRMHHRSRFVGVSPPADTIMVPSVADPGACELTARSADCASTGPQLLVRARPIRQIVVMDVSGRLSDIVQELDVAIQQALSTEPRGVACDLTNVLADDEPDALALLATSGRHVRDWSGTPLAVSSPRPSVRSALSAQPLGERLTVTKSLLSALYAVLRTPAPAVGHVRLASQPTASRAAHDFVANTLLDWQLARLTPSAALVARELVTSAQNRDEAGGDIDLSIAWTDGSLRLTVRNTAAGGHQQHRAHAELRGRGLTLVAGLSRAHGVLPAPDGGQVMWAVLDVPKPQSTALEGRDRSQPASPEQVAREGPRRAHPPTRLDPSYYLG